MASRSPERELWASVLSRVIKDLQESRGVLLLYEGTQRRIREMPRTTQQERRRQRELENALRNRYRHTLRILVGVRLFIYGEDSVLPLICDWLELDFEQVHEYLKRRDSGWLPQKVKEDLQRDWRRCDPTVLQ